MVQPVGGYRCSDQKQVKDSLVTTASNVDEEYDSNDQGARIAVALMTRVDGNAL